MSSLWFGGCWSGTRGHKLRATSLKALLAPVDHRRSLSVSTGVAPSARQPPRCMYATPSSAAYAHRSCLLGMVLPVQGQHAPACRRWHRIQGYPYTRRGHVPAARCVGVPTVALVQTHSSLSLVANTPHNPVRFKDTIGLVMERVRPEGSIGTCEYPALLLLSTYHPHRPSPLVLQDARTLGTHNYSRGAVACDRSWDAVETYHSQVDGERRAAQVPFVWRYCRGEVAFFVL